jgi:hypothetical protein
MQVLTTAPGHWLMATEDRPCMQVLTTARVPPHQVRYDAATVGSACRVKFMTDGVLLRELQSDLACKCSPQRAVPPTRCAPA